MSGREVDNCWTHNQIHFGGGGFFLWASYTVAEFFEIFPGEVIGLCSGGHSAAVHCSAVRGKHSFTSLMKLMSELSDQVLWIKTALKAVPGGEATQKRSPSVCAFECHCRSCSSCLLSLGHQVHMPQWQGNTAAQAGQPCRLSKRATEGVPTPLGVFMSMNFQACLKSQGKTMPETISMNWVLSVGFLWNLREASCLTNLLFLLKYSHL